MMLDSCAWLARSTLRVGGFVFPLCSWFGSRPCTPCDGSLPSGLRAVRWWAWIVAGGVWQCAFANVGPESVLRTSCLGYDYRKMQGYGFALRQSIWLLVQAIKRSCSKVWVSLSPHRRSGASSRCGFWVVGALVRAMPNLVLVQTTMMFVDVARLIGGIVCSSLANNHDDLRVKKFVLLTRG